MELSNFKLGIYDLLGLILPGLLLVVELWIGIRGWPSFATSINSTGGFAFSVLLLASFGLGHLIQEIGDFSLKSVKGPRFFKRARDDFWATDEGANVRNAIWADIHLGVASVDAAFDYCLAKIQGRFPNRDAFLATSDLARSFVILAIVGLFPALRIAHDSAHTKVGFCIWSSVCCAGLAIVALAAWSRMQRFRELSDVTVFRAYLGTRGQPLPGQETARPPTEEAESQ